MIHLYGVVSELRELPSVHGLDGAPLERRHIEGLEVVVSRTAREVPDVSEEAILRHAEVVEELMAQSDAVLPAQFGRAFVSEDELSGAVRTKAPELKSGLSRVQGCMEFGLRVLGREPTSKDAPPRSSGSDYMRARLAHAKERDRLAALFHEPLARLSRASARFSGVAEDLLEAAYLVPEENVDAFLDRVRRLEAKHAEVTVVCTGPWPPYSFAAERKGDA